MTILASTVNCKTMADDSLRLTIDISPQDAKAAFSLFGARGLPCVIARLNPEAALEAQQEATIEADKPKGGELARLAGMFCQQPEFCEWADLNDGIEAAAFIRYACRIGSRAELDHNDAAASAFHEKIRRPYVEWRKARGLNE